MLGRFQFVSMKCNGEPSDRWKTCEEYAGFVEHGVTGFLVRHDHEWGRYLYELVNDEAMRAEMGAAAKKLAATWTIQQRYGAWETAYREVMDRALVP